MFWDRFYSLCEKNGTKPNPVGTKIGISSGIITKWKTGTMPNGESLIKIADYFNISIDYLVGRTNDDSPFKGESDYEKTFKNHLHEILMIQEKQTLNQVGIDSESLIDILYGKKKLTFEMACDIADSLGYTLNFLFGLTNEE